MAAALCCVQQNFSGNLNTAGAAALELDPGSVVGQENSSNLGLRRVQLLRELLDTEPFSRCDALFDGCKVYSRFLCCDGFHEKLSFKVQKAASIVVRTCLAIPKSRPFSPFLFFCNFYGF